jgi:hypothetical protein
MMYLNLSVSNPWYKKPTKEKEPATYSYSNLLAKHGPVCKNKHWELEIIKDPEKILGLELSLSLRRRDHAGLQIGFCILGYDCAFRIYDVRHWDYEKDSWKE